MILMPMGVRTPVVSISTRALIGIVQAFETPGICIASLKPPGPYISSSIVLWSSQALRNIPCNQPGAQLEYQRDFFGHCTYGLSSTTVSIIENGAGSVAVSARPALPKTRATSGKLLSVLSIT